MKRTFTPVAPHNHTDLPPNGGGWVKLISASLSLETNQILLQNGTEAGVPVGAPIAVDIASLLAEQETRLLTASLDLPNKQLILQNGNSLGTPTGSPIIVDIAPLVDSDTDKYVHAASFDRDTSILSITQKNKAGTTLSPTIDANLSRIVRPQMQFIGPSIVPEFHLRASNLSLTPKVLIIGDSISTNDPTQTHDETESMWGHLQRAFREANPHLNPSFINMGWGGTTWSTVTKDTVAVTIAGGAQAPTWAYGDGSLNWLGYAEAQTPDLVFFAFGMNDRQNFVTSQARATINAIKAWAKVPDIIFITPMVPHRTSADTNMSSVDAQEGRYFTAHWMRTWALYNRAGLLDLNRQYARTVQGVDPRQTHMTRDGSATARALPYTFPNECDQDFGIEMAVTPAQLAAGIKLSLSRTGVNSSSELWITTSGGFIKTQFITILVTGVPNEQIETISTFVTPVISSVLKVFIKDNVASIKINDSPVFEGPIIRHGGRFIPVVSMLDASTPTADITTWTGKYIQNTPLLDDNEMWGDTLTSNLTTGGNDLNHPTSLGAANVFRPLFDGQNWGMSGYSLGATDFANTAGNNLGIGTKFSKGKLHIAKAPIPAGITPTAQANNLVLENDGDVGMSFFTAVAGIVRILFGTTADVDLGGITYNSNTGLMSFRANNLEAGRFSGDPAANQTGLSLLMNDGSTVTLKTVTVGAADSAGTGFRQLRVSN